MALARPCLGCGELIGSGSRCTRCTRHTRMRGRAWQRRRMAAMRNFNYLCGRCDRAIAEEVHHRDGDPANNSFLNLLPVCRPCHRELEADKRAGSS